MQLHLVALVCCLACCYVVVYLAFLRAVRLCGFVAVKVLRALVKWNSSGTLLDCSDSSFSNSIGLAKPNKCQQRLRFMTCPNVLSCDVAWFDTVSIPLQANETICHAFLNRRKVFVIGGRKLVAHNSLLGLLSLSLSLTLSFFVYLRYAYTSIIQMRSQQEASSCGLSRGLAQAALNPFSAFAFAFTFALLCFGCIYLALCLEALPLRGAGSRAARGSVSL